MVLYGLTYTGKIIYIINVHIICHSWLPLSVSNDQLSFIYLTDLMIHNMENVRPTRYEVMNDIK